MTAKKLRDVLNRAADGVSRAAGGVADTAQSAAKVFADAARATPDAVAGVAEKVVEVAQAAPGVVSDAAQKVADTAQAAAGHVGDAFNNVKASVLDGVTYVDNRMQAARTGTANALELGGEFLGKATMVAGETALFSAGVLPILFFYDLPIKAGDKVTETIDGIAKFVRGDRVQFIGINLVGGGLLTSPQDARAIIYDPHMPSRDNNGYVELSEESIAHHLKIMDDETRGAREPQYKAALLAVQEARKRYGLPLKSPGIRGEDIVGAADLLLHMAIF